MAVTHRNIYALFIYNFDRFCWNSRGVNKARRFDVDTFSGRAVDLFFV